MRKVWIIVGFLLGALCVWALTHKKRKMGDVYAQMLEEDQRSAMELRMDLAMDGAIDGIDYVKFLDNRESIPSHMWNDNTNEFDNEEDDEDGETSLPA